MSSFSEKRTWIGALAAFVLATAVGALNTRAQPMQAANGDLETIEIRPGVYMIAGAGANITVQVGRLGAILVNAGTEEMADKVLAAVNRVSRQPIRYIINTSADADVVGGSAKLSQAGRTILAGAVGNPGVTEDVITNNGAASVMAHENVLARMSATAGGKPLFPSAQWPTKTISGKNYSMYLNGEGIQVFPEPAAHTDGDSIVFFRRNDVLVTGAVWDTTRLPVIDLERGGSIQGEIAALNHLLDLAIPPLPLVWEEDRTLLITGHGRIGDASDLVEYRDMVTIIRDNVQDMLDRKMTLDQVKKADPAKAYRTRYDAGSGAWTSERFVEAVYKSLTGKQ